MIQPAQRRIARCTLLLFALGMGGTPLAQAQTYLCKQADGSEVMTDDPAGSTCKPFNPQEGAMRRTPSRDELKAQELLETQRRAEAIPMRSAAAAAAIVAIFVILLIVWRRNSTPSVAMFKEIERGISELQRRALRNVVAEHTGYVRGIKEDVMLNQTLILNGTIRFVYTIEQRNGGFVHLVSSQLKHPKGQKYHVQCALVVMLVLGRQLAESGINQDDVKFDLDESTLGTQFVAMLLSADQHERLSTHIGRQPHSQAPPA